MRLKVLERRAVSEGVPADAVEDAMDHDNPKRSLVRLIIALASGRGPRDRLLAALSSEKDTKLAQKLGQLQPCIAVFPQECMGQLASFGPT